MNPSWIKALVFPKETFKEEKIDATIKGALINILLGGLIAGTIYAIIFSLGEGLFSLIAVIITVITTPIIVAILLFFTSGLLYVIAKILKGKGNFATQTYLISLIYAPILVLAAILSVIPLVGDVISTLLSLYSLYPLTIALREIHQFSIKRAIATWLLPYMVIMVIVFILGVILWQVGFFAR